MRAGKQDNSKKGNHSHNSQCGKVGNKGKEKPHCVTLLH